MTDKQPVITTKTIIVAISTIVGLFLSFVALQTYIDGRIQKQIEDPVFLKRLGGEITPSVIFDSRGSILADEGAMQFIDEIVVKRHSDIKFAAKEITVRPKAFLAEAPILTSIDQNNYAITSH